MLSFAKNNCRFCTKAFCCITCRQKHESKVHNVYPDCDICAYGKTILKSPTDDLLNHIKEQHWPLYCVDCNRIFGALDELIVHNKCPLAKTSATVLNTPLTPNIIIDTKKQIDSDSPPVTATFKYAVNTPSSNELFNNKKLIQLTTSTPRDCSNDSLHVFGITTPSDTENKSENTNNSVTNDTKDQQPKRRVTFNETPIYDSLRKTHQEQKILKSSLKRSSMAKTPEISFWGNKLDITSSLEAQKQIETPKYCATVWETACIETPEIKISSDEPSLTMYDSCHSKIEIQNITSQDISESNMAVLSEVQKIFKKSQSVSIWTSMTCLVKNFVVGLSSNTSMTDDKATPQLQNFSTPKQSAKRPRSDDLTEEFKRMKKMKLTDIQCRKPINDTIPYRFFVKRRRPQYCDKATQTD